VSEAEAAASMTGEKLPYYTRCGDAYRHITNVYRADRPTKRIAEGSKVTFRYEAYLFESGPANIPFATNNRGTGKILAEEYGLDTTYWDFSPAVRILGTDPIIKGLELTLPDCAKGDTVYTFMPYEVAYGDRAMGVIAAESAVMMVTVIDDVE
jgi:FKBP-type peptidyl-prolyl cis-trans isomerase 2